MIAIEEMPTRIRSIRNPRWRDELRWTYTPTPSFMTDVDHDWRLWVNPYSGGATVRHKGESAGRFWNTLTEALAFLDYEVDE